MGTAGAPHDARRPRLLLVEDDALICALLADALDERYDVVRARTAMGALLVFAVEGPDLLLLDYRLPGGTADALLREADRLGGPALTITGCPLAAAEVEARGRPVLAKPFGMDELRGAPLRLPWPPAPA